MRPKRWTFTVSGRLSFPDDMLRYDRCWPADSDAAQEMLLAASPTRPRRDYTIRMIGEQHPTEARWLSYLWGVADIQEEP
jgi:hypothetical protein